MTQSVEGVRVVLKSADSTHLWNYFDSFNRTIDIQNLCPSLDWEDSERFFSRFQNWLQRTEEYKLSWFSIFTNNTDNNFIGAIGLKEKNYSQIESSMTIGIRVFILPQYRRVNLARESLFTLLAYLRKTDQLPPNITIEFAFPLTNQNGISFVQSLYFLKDHLVIDNAKMICYFSKCFSQIDQLINNQLKEINYYIYKETLKIVPKLVCTLNRDHFNIMLNLNDVIGSLLPQFIPVSCEGSCCNVDYFEVLPLTNSEIGFRPNVLNLYY